MTRGRPLRFLALTLAGWTALRVVMLWPAGQALPGPRRLAQARPVASLLPVRLAVATPAALTGPRPAILPVLTTQEPLPALASEMALEQAAAEGAPATQVWPAVLVATAAALPSQALTLAAPLHPEMAGPADLPADAGTSRLGGSGWLVFRQGAGDSLAFGQLGASQGGARLTYRLASGIALSGRISTPLHGRGREAALGLDWQPTRWPVHLLAEQRIDTDTGRRATAVEAIAGVAAPLPAGLALDAYAQAGAVARRGGFVDGAARVSATLVETGAARIEGGAGLWGGAQGGAARLDIGPTLGVAVPSARGGVRLSLDYRLRIAGRAAPGSGPALTLGTSF